MSEREKTMSRMRLEFGSIFAPKNAKGTFKMIFFISVYATLKSHARSLKHFISVLAVSSSTVYDKKKKVAKSIT